MNSSDHSPPAPPGSTPRLLVSIPVHERRAVVLDQVRNYRRLLPSATVVLHLSQSFAEDADFSQEPNVVVNPNRLATKWGAIAHTHISNVEFALARRMDFDFVIYAASNEMLVRPGLAEYVVDVDALIDPRGRLNADGDVDYYSPFLAKSCLTNKPRRFLSPVAEKYGSTVWGSQIEGSGYRREAVLEMHRFIRAEIGFDVVAAKGFAIEESIFPTAFSAIQSTNSAPKIKLPTTFVDFREELSGSRMIELIRYIRGDSNPKMERYLKSIDIPRELYAVKRVARRYFDPVRIFIREQTCGVEPLTSEIEISYRNDDAAHLLRERRSQRTWKHFSYKLAAVCSRLMLQNPSFLRFDVLDRYRAWKRRRRRAAALRAQGKN
jgi:hypothetical protein